MSANGTDSLVCGQNCLNCIKFTNPNGDIYYKCNTEEQSDSSVIIIILVVVGVLLLVVAVIVIVIKLRRRKFLSTTTQHRKIQEIDEGQVNNNIEYFVSTKIPKTLMDENAFGETMKHPNTGNNAGNVIIHKILTDATKKRDSVIKNIPISTNCRNLQPQQIVQNIIREKYESRSKPVSEMALQGMMGENGSLDATPVNKARKKSMLKYNYKQLKQKEISQFGRDYDAGSVDFIQVSKRNDGNDGNDV
jgi:hypothetical protein